MPKVPMDYSKCCIYKIEHVDDESLVYVGHTTCFDKRKTKHKSSCCNDNDSQICIILCLSNLICHFVTFLSPE